jgi:hypothetical protein
MSLPAQPQYALSQEVCDFTATLVGRHFIGRDSSAHGGAPQDGNGAESERTGGRSAVTENKKQNCLSDELPGARPM